MLEGTLNRETYVQFFQDNISALLDKVNPVQRHAIIYQQDDAPAHFTNKVRD